MSKAEEILEMAEIMCGNYADGICAVDGCICNHNCEFNLTANHLYNRGYQYQQRWIPVSERLPDCRDGKVLVFTIYGFSICERTVNSRWQGKHANWITHWMPLPLPPETEKGGE